MKKYLLKFSLVIVGLLFSMSYVYSQSAISKWDGKSTSMEWFTMGSGSTYHISSAADLAGLSNSLGDGYYLNGDYAGMTIILDCDIDLCGYEWRPIGNLTARQIQTSFAGTFDGNNHKISGLKITKMRGSDALGYAGLFGYNYGTPMSIKNLIVEGDINISSTNLGSYGTANVGGIAATTSGTITNCKSLVNINLTLSSGQRLYCGGIAGEFSGSLCSKCSALGSINASLTNSHEPYVGGIIGMTYKDDFEGSELTSSSDMVIGNGRMTFAGGIIGRLNGTLSNSLFTGSLKATYSTYGIIGGLIGSFNSGSIINKSIAIASITKTGGTAYISPISGMSGSGLLLSNCYYLSGMSNNNGLGTSITESNLKSGSPLNGFDTKIWTFNKGSYPFLAFTMDKSKQCATPTISFVDGKIKFECETKNVKYHYTIKADQKELSDESENDIVELVKTYTVTCYASAEGYADSETATVTISIDNSGLKGDMNDDGKLSVSDLANIAEIILSGE